MYFVGTNREGLDVPLHHVLLRYPLGAACSGLELGRVRVAGHRHQNGHVVGSGAALELTPSLRKVTACVVKRIHEHRNSYEGGLRDYSHHSLVIIILGGFQCPRQMASAAVIHLRSMCHKY